MTNRQIKPLPAVEILRATLRLEVKTGTLFWLPRIGNDRSTLSFNAKYAGKRALSTIDAHSYHKVHVTLRNGWTSRASSAWPAADGRPPTRWTLEGHPFDILEWEIAQ